MPFPLPLELAAGATGGALTWAGAGSEPAASARTRGASMAGVTVRAMGRGPRAQTPGHPSNWPWQITPQSGQAHARSPALIGWPQPSRI